MVTNRLQENRNLVYNRHMTSFIRKVKTKSGATAVQIKHKQGRQRVGITHIGSAHTEAELELLLQHAQDKLNEDQLSFDFGKEKEPEIALEKSYSELLWSTLDKIYKQLGFEEINDKVYKQLVLARIIEPVSKLDTIRVLEELGLEAPSNTSIHRCLKRIIEENYRDTISKACIKQTPLKTMSLVLYDVTTLYFEIQKEDEYRKSGLSKERRLEPQIIIGLLVDSTGFPLEIQSYEGNKAEVKTIIPILSRFREKHGLENITVTADAAMLSSGNIAELEELGYHYIIGSRLSKTPYEIKEHLVGKDAPIKDGQIIESEMVVTIDEKRKKRRVIYQYRQKRAALDLLNIEKALQKAQKMVEKKANIKRNRFLKIKNDKREINEELVTEARQKAGIKGYVTDLKIPAQQVIDAYHSLFQVEKAFRISKSDLKARPIYHQKRDSIEAHLTIVFTSLAITKYIEKKTMLSIRKFVNMLKPIRSGIISIKGVKYPIKPQIPEKISSYLRKLK